MISAIPTTPHYPVTGHRASGVACPASEPPPYIIPVFIPHAGCPHRCVFCNQQAITCETEGILKPETLRKRISEFLGYRLKQTKKIQLAFYGGNFLGLERNYLVSLLDEAEKFVVAGVIDSIRFSTRPDTIDAERLNLIKAYSVSTIELGVQCLDDGVLIKTRRGHSAADTIRAVGLLKERPYHIGLQMMVGLPGDDGTASLYTADRIASLSPAFVRIYPTLVLAGSPMADWFKSGRYVPMTLAACVTLTKSLLHLFARKQVRVIRLGLQATDKFDSESVILAGPYHPAFGELVYSQIFLDKATALLDMAGEMPDTLSLRVHPRSISKMRGQKNKNVTALKKRYRLKCVYVVPDPDLKKSELRIDYRPWTASGGPCTASNLKKMRIRFPAERIMP